jgi:hypothetical protein
VKNFNRFAHFFSGKTFFEKFSLRPFQKLSAHFLKQERRKAKRGRVSSSKRADRREA